jgi:hypothetical protein
MPLDAGAFRPLPALATAILISASAAVFEELAFRGVLQPLAQRGLSLLLPGQAAAPAFHGATHRTTLSWHGSLLWQELLWCGSTALLSHITLLICSSSSPHRGSAHDGSPHDGYTHDGYTHDGYTPRIGRCRDFSSGAGDPFRCVAFLYAQPRLPYHRVIGGSRTRRCVRSSSSSSSSMSMSMSIGESKRVGIAIS